jgi:predicted kinase
MASITIPDPCLILLVGAAGSGKSTFAARHFAADEILSSDALRAAISGDAADQRATRPAFASLHRQLARRLAEGRLTVVDATNAQTHGRRSLLRSARAAGVEVTAIVFDLPAVDVHARNAGRSERIVDAEVVDRHLAEIRDIVDRDRLTAEGIAQVVILRSIEEVDELHLRRRPIEP